MAGLALALLVAARAMLVAQNLLMARIADGGPPILVALVTNSGIGLLVLPNNRTVCILAAAFGDCVTGKGRERSGQ